MTEYVRVRDTATGHHITVSAALAARHPKRYAALKQDATDMDGKPLPPRYKTAPSGTQDADAPAPDEAPEATTTEAKEAKK